MWSKVAKDLLEKVESGSGRVLTEYESKKIFSAAGIPVTEEILAATIEDVITAGAKIGYPLVLKISSPDICHKSDFGGVYVGLKDEGELELAASNLKERAMAEGIEFSFLVQEMAKKGQELLIGSKRDPTFGPVLIFGLGGVFTEILDDVSIRISPIKREDAHRMVHEIKGAEILEGFRGMAPIDIEAVVDVMLKVAMIMETYEAITELDINPLLGYEKGVLAVDGLIIL